MMMPGSNGTTVRRNNEDNSSHNNINNNNNNMGRESQGSEGQGRVSRHGSRGGPNPVSASLPTELSRFTKQTKRMKVLLKVREE